MVRKSKKDIINKWNFPIEKGTKIIHENMIQILKEKESTGIEVHELIHLLNLRTKRINFKLYGKRKTISSYIDYYYTNIVNFADSFMVYNVVYKGGKVYIKLNEENEESYVNPMKKSPSDLDNWEFIDVPPILNCD